MDCFICKGATIKSVTTFVADLKSCLVIVRNVPCDECTQCGETFIADDVAAALDRLVNEARQAHTQIAVLTFTADVA